MNFDTIIIGAGSAGCVHAGKLSENPHHRVLLLEAGPRGLHPILKLPLGYAFTYADSRWNWRYWAQPDPGLAGRSAYWPRGKVVAGSGAINAMAYVRGLAHDYDDWHASGAQGWDWQSVKASFEALELPLSGYETEPKAARKQDRLQPLNKICVADLHRSMHPINKHFYRAAEQMKWPLIDDMNAPQGEGVSAFRATQRAGQRFTSADGFLRPALRRKNLQLITNAHVEKILFQGKRAQGVRFRMHNQIQTAYAEKEVILCAGAINSPKLLQLSGLGAGALLQSMNIDVVLDNPRIGAGLQDHLCISTRFYSQENTINHDLGSLMGQARAALHYALTRKGYLSIPINQVGGFVRSSAEQPAPDMQLYCNPALYSVPVHGKPSLARQNGFLLSMQPCRPTSRGHITLKSPDPNDAPLIYPNSLSTQKDQQDALSAAKLLQDFARRPAMSAVIRSATEQDIRTMDDKALYALFEQVASSNFHASCTCAMGHSLADSVTDSALRVHGVQALRVVDASAFPNITSGNTNAPTLMLAYRAAQIISAQGLR